MLVFTYGMAPMLLVNHAVRIPVVGRLAGILEYLHHRAIFCVRLPGLR